MWVGTGYGYVCRYVCMVLGLSREPLDRMTANLLSGICDKYIGM